MIMEDENGLADIREVFPQKISTSESFDNDNKLTLKSFFAFCSLFFLKKGPADERWKQLRDSHSVRFPIYSSPELKRAKTYSALSFDGINLFNMTNLFSLSRTPFVICYCFREPMKTFFFDACQMIVKSRVLYSFPVPQTGRSH